MSNPLKGLGKIFKGVVKIIKKVALPALAIGAVVLTGGAALGLLPSVGSLAANLGLSAGLTSVLTSAATSATIGAGLAAVTGKNILKGATTGFITGGILGGVNAAMGGTTDIFGKAASKGLGTAADISSKTLDGLRATGGLPIAAQGTANLAAGAGLPIAAQGTTNLAASGLGNVASSVAPSTASAVASAAAPSSGGILGFLNKNPVPAGMAVQGLGQGLMAMEQAKEAQRERDRIAASYTTEGLPQYQSQGNGYAPAADFFNSAIFAGKMATYNPKTGQVQVRNA